MPTYKFVCDPCEEHPDEAICREVHMSIPHFSNEGRLQLCDKCGKAMRHVIEMPSVHWRGPGSSPKAVPQKEREDLTAHLEGEYYDQAVRSGALDEAKDTETIRMNRWRNTKTGEKIHVPVED